MKNHYENYNDLLEAATNYGFDVLRVNDNRAVVYETLGPALFMRDDNGWTKYAQEVA